MQKNRIMTDCCGRIYFVPEQYFVLSGPESVLRNILNSEDNFAVFVHNLETNESGFRHYSWKFISELVECGLKVT
nr:MAG TPA: hypothetical protein [Caudoviricetes sp.]